MLLNCLSLKKKRKQDFYVSLAKRVCRFLFFHRRPLPELPPGQEGAVPAGERPGERRGSGGSTRDSSAPAARCVRGERSHGAGGVSSLPEPLCPPPPHGEGEPRVPRRLRRKNPPQI